MQWIFRPHIFIRISHSAIYAIIRKWWNDCDITNWKICVCIHFRLNSENFHNGKNSVCVCKRKTHYGMLVTMIKYALVRSLNSMLYYTCYPHRVRIPLHRFYEKSVCIFFFPLCSSCLVQFDYLVAVPFFHPSPWEIIGLYIIVSEYSIFSVNHLLDLCNCNTITLGTERYNTL